MSRLAKQALAFIIGLSIMGGLVYWSMADSLNSLKENNSKQSLMEMHSTNMFCATNDTPEKCTTTYKIKANGSYKDLDGKTQQLTKDQIATLKKLIKEADFSILNPGSGEYCHANTDRPQISYSFNSINDPTWYVPCMSTNPRELPLFKFIETDLHLPLDTKS